MGLDVTDHQCRQIRTILQPVREFFEDSRGGLVRLDAFAWLAKVSEYRSVGLSCAEALRKDFLDGIDVDKIETSLEISGIRPSHAFHL
jgi:hypothetical protein